jgi:hypothetical protein
MHPLHLCVSFSLFKQLRAFDVLAGRGNTVESFSISPTQNNTSFGPSINVAKETHGATDLNPSAQLPVLELSFVFTLSI